MRFERLVNQHKDAVYRQMVRVCGNHDDAEDALAQALLNAFQASESLQTDEAFRGWLAAIGRRVCYRMRERDKFRQILGPLMEADIVETGTAQDQVEREEMKQCIRAAVEGLPETYRMVYILREVEQRTAPEVCRLTGLSLPAMKSRLHRARALVRQNLEDSLCLAATYPQVQPVWMSDTGS